MNDNITPYVRYIGADDKDLDLFESQYVVPQGISYNSYVITDEKIAVMDTIDQRKTDEWTARLEEALEGRTPDYLIVQHMEPDHAANIGWFAEKYPEATIVASAKAIQMMPQFFEEVNFAGRTQTVKEGDTLCLGQHTLKFIMAPMVHWPEVMLTYEESEKILFSADAFGKFGALCHEGEWIDEARRYYFNIVGKYGPQVQSLLKKAHSLDIKMICSLHGFVWRRNLEDIFDKYVKWSTYTPEENGVMIAYASVYGNTENTAEIISSRLRDLGIKTVMFDVSVTPASEIIAAAFKWSHLLFASTTYNAGIFVSMEELLHDLAAHNIQDRTVAFVENGSWAPTSGKLMREIMSGCKDMRILDETLTLKSSLKPEQTDEIDALVKAISDTIPRFEKPVIGETDKDILKIDPAVFHKFSYGLFVLTTQADGKDNGCIINTAAQLTSTPGRINIAVNKANYTHDMILHTGVFNVSVLAEDASFDTFKRFGFASGKDTDKFAGFTEHVGRSKNGLTYVTLGTNAFLSAKVIDSYDYGTHTLFIAEVTESQVLRDMPSVTYGYYFEHIKPKPQPKIEEEKHGYVCKICGYVYEGDTLPPDFVCPLCKHGADDFEKI